MLAFVILLTTDQQSECHSVGMVASSLTKFRIITQLFPNAVTIFMIKFLRLYPGVFSLCVCSFWIRMGYVWDSLIERELH